MRTFPLQLPGLNIVDSLTSLRGISVENATDVCIMRNDAESRRVEIAGLGTILTFGLQSCIDTTQVVGSMM